MQTGAHGRAGRGAAARSFALPGHNRSERSGAQSDLKTRAEAIAHKPCLSTAAPLPARAPCIDVTSDLRKRVHRNM